MPWQHKMTVFKINMKVARIAGNKECVEGTWMSIVRDMQQTRCIFDDICHVYMPYCKDTETAWGEYITMSAMASQITSLKIVYSTVCSGEDQRKHQSSASLAFVRVIHRWPVNSPHKWPVTRQMFPFDDVILILTICVISPIAPSLVIFFNNRRIFKTLTQ